jgi:hypothetical protein
MTTQLNPTIQNDGIHQKSNGQHDTSLAAGSGFEELVPSRYAVRVGGWGWVFLVLGGLGVGVG